MLDEDSCCVLESLLGMNAPVSGDLEGQLLVVSLLLYTIVLREVLDITDRRIDRVDSDRLQLILLSRVDQLLISGDVTTPLVDRELDSKGIRLIDVADDQLGIEDFEGSKLAVELASEELLLTRDRQADGLLSSVLDEGTEADLLQVENDVSYILQDTRNSSKFMIDTFDLDGRDGKAFE